MFDLWFTWSTVESGGLSRMQVLHEVLISTSGIPRPLKFQEDRIIGSVIRRMMGQAVLTHGHSQNPKEKFCERRVKRVLIQVREDQ